MNRKINLTGIRLGLELEGGEGGREGGREREREREKERERERERILLSIIDIFFSAVQSLSKVWNRRIHTSSRWCTLSPAQLRSRSLPRR